MSVHIYRPESVEEVSDLSKYNLEGPQSLTSSKFRHKVKSASIARYYDCTYLNISTVCGLHSNRTADESRFFPCTMRRRPCKKCYPEETKG